MIKYEILEVCNALIISVYSDTVKQYSICSFVLMWAVRQPRLLCENGHIQESCFCSIIALQSVILTLFQLSHVNRSCELSAGGQIR